MQAVLGNFVMVLFAKIIVFCRTISYNIEKYFQWVHIMTKYLNYSYEQLERFCVDCFKKYGFTEEQSKIISDVRESSTMAVV